MKEHCCLDNLIKCGENMRNKINSMYADVPVENFNSM